MAILYSLNKGKLVTLNHDPDSKAIYTLIYRPEIWTAGREVIQDNVILIPSVPNGCMYICVQGGVTGIAEPIWKTQKNSITTSGNTLFKALPYNLLLKTGDTIRANTGDGWPAYELLLPSGIIIDNTALINSSIVQFRVISVPGIGTYNITCRISILKSNGIYTRYDDTIILNIIEA
jgi:hypothetical protein